MTTKNKMVKAEFDEKVKPLNDVLQYLGVAVTVNFFKSGCGRRTLVDLHMASITDPSKTYFIFAPFDSHSMENNIHVAIAYLSGKTIRLYDHGLVSKTSFLEDTIKVNFPVFSSPKELEMKLKLMGRL